MWASTEPSFPLVPLWVERRRSAPHLGGKWGCDSDNPLHSDGRERPGKSTDCVQEAGVQSCHSRTILAGSSQLQLHGDAQTFAMRRTRDLHYYHVEIQVAAAGRQRPPVREDAARTNCGLRRRDGRVSGARAVGQRTDPDKCLRASAEPGQAARRSPPISETPQSSISIGSRNFVSFR